MKKLVASLVILFVIGSNNVMASNLADGFNWPDGFSSASSDEQQLKSQDTYGFNWPEGRSFENSIIATSHANVAEGFNWPEGF